MKNFSVNAARFQAVSDDLATSHRIKKPYGVSDADLEHRMQIAFIPPPKVGKRGRPPADQPKIIRNDQAYRRVLTHKAYQEALTHGSFFFLAFLISFPTMSCSVAAVQRLIAENENATKHQFSLNAETRKVLETWAQEGRYTDNEVFIKFFNGLSWLKEDSLALESCFHIVKQLIAERGLGKNDIILSAIDILFSGDTRTQERVQVETGTQTDPDITETYQVDSLEETKQRSPNQSRKRRYLVDGPALPVQNSELVTHTPAGQYASGKTQLPSLQEMALGIPSFNRNYTHDWGRTINVREQ